jgi:4'-phosphopantetheinyl transferase
VPPGVVDLWWIELCEFASRAGELATLLSEDERARAARFHFERDRRRYQTARSLLRSLLGQYLDTPPERLRFLYGAHDKPSLEGNTAEAAALSFNVSHSGDFALLAIAGAGSVGVDVEALREVEDPEELAASWMSASDRAALAGAPAAERSALLLRCWTRYEAVLKARGVGLGETTPEAAAEGLVIADVQTPTSAPAALATDFVPTAMRRFFLDARAWSGAAERGVLATRAS